MIPRPASATPLVSVIIPTFNRAGFLPIAIESALAQSYAACEVIVVDDGSTDGTERVVTGFGEAVRYIKQPHQERSAARNRGVAESNGSIVAFLDSDDRWLSAHVEELVHALDQSDAIAAYSSFSFETTAGKQLQRFPGGATGDVFQAVLSESVCIVPSAAVVRRAAFDQIGGFTTGLSMGEDWEFFLRLAARGSFACAPAFTAVMTDHAGRSMRDPACIMEAPAAVDSAARDPLVRARGMMDLPRVKATRQLKLAVNLMAQGKMRESRSWLMQSLSSDKKIFTDPRFAKTLLRSFLGTGMSRRLSMSAAAIRSRCTRQSRRHEGRA